MKLDNNNRWVKVSYGCSSSAVSVHTSSAMNGGCPRPRIVGVKLDDKPNSSKAERKIDSDVFPVRAHADPEVKASDVVAQVGILDQEYQWLRGFSGRLSTPEYHSSTPFLSSARQPYSLFLSKSILRDFKAIASET